MEDAKLLEIDTRTAKLEKIDRLMRKVEARQGGHGDFTKEKQGRSVEQEETLYKQFQEWRAKRHTRMPPP